MTRVAVLVLFVAGCPNFGSPPPSGLDAEVSPDAAIDAAPPDASIGCPANYGSLPGAPPNPHRYRLSPLGSAGFNSHRTLCESHAPNAYLAIPDDAAELTGLAMAAGSTPFWVGITDQVTEGTYLTVRGAAAVFLPWAGGQPDDAGAGEDCVSASSANISDSACNNTFIAVCECDP
jgi:hypothetical protein